MGVVQLSKVTLVMPRSEIPEATRQLCEFEWFHPKETEAKILDPAVDSLSSRAFKVFVDLDELARALDIKVEPGVLEIITKGVRIEKHKMRIQDWASLVAELEAEARPLIEDLGGRLQESSRARKAVSDLETFEAALTLVAQLNIDLGSLRRLKMFSATFFITSTKDVKEIKRSLPEAVFVETPVTREKSSILVVSLGQDAEKVERTLRSFEVKPFEIPADLPQNPSQAYSIVRERLEAERGRLAKTEAETSELAEKMKSKLLTLRETGQVAYAVLSTVRKPGEMKRFAVVEGYIPSLKQKEFDQKFARWIRVFEEVSRGGYHGSAAPSAPTLTSNMNLVKPFENITLTQGSPSYGEVDPTPMIALVFPIFFGLMFGDAGQGLMLFLLGMLLRIRGNESLKHWGTIIAAAGLSATVVGVLVGEIFGFSTGSFVPALKSLTLVEFVEHEHETLNVQGGLMVMIVFALLVGVLHLTVGLTIGIVNEYRRREYVEMVVERIPTLTLYLFGVLWVLSLFGVGLKFDRLYTSSEPAPFIGVASGPLATVAILGAVASMVVLVFGKGVAIMLGKHPGGGAGMTIFISFIETLFERLPGFLSNTVSYVRLAALLTVHASLLLALNRAWSMGIAALPLIVIGNILIAALEALLVFIQDLRLHLYEWFTKFYSGSGVIFRKIMPPTTYVDLKWVKEA